MACNESINLAGCNCTYEPCPRKGKCCDCMRYHRSRDELPACFFSAADEASYDRTYRRFVRANS